MMTFKITRAVFQRGREQFPTVRGVAFLNDRTIAIDYGASTLQFGKNESGRFVSVHHCNHVVTTTNYVACNHLGMALALYHQCTGESVEFPAPAGGLSHIEVDVEVEPGEISEVKEDITERVLGRASRADWGVFPDGLPTPDEPLVPYVVEDTESPSSSEIDDDYKNVHEYLVSQSVPLSLLERIQTFRDKYGHKKDSPYYHRVRKDKYIGSTVLASALRSMLLGHSILLVGPKGCGKNVLTEALSWTLGLPIFELSGNYQTEKSELIGDKTLDIQDDGQMKVVRELGVVIQAMETGAILLVDEFNFIRPEIASLLNPVTDKRKRIEVPGYGVVIAKPGFRVVKTMNYGYAGTSEVNEATVDRDDIFVLTPNINVLDILTKEVPLLDASIASKLANFFSSIVASAENNELPESVVSIRGLISAAELIDDGLDPVEAVQIGIVNKVFDETYRDACMNLVHINFGGSRTRRR